MFAFILFSLFYMNSALQNSKICTNCKHYFIEKDNDNVLKARCMYFTKDKDKENKDTIVSNEFIKRKKIIYLVTGKEINKIVNKRDLYFCCTARTFEHLCGIEGKKYEEKEWFHLF